MAKITKAEAVRQTIAAGVTKPADGADHVKKTFGLAITPAMFSSYKSAAARKAVGPTRRTAANGSVSIAAVADVKKVMDRYGADTVKELMAALT